MNASLKKILVLILAAAASPAVFADAAKAPDPKAPPAKPPAPASVFAMPTSAREGRDPFFPDSTRPYEENKPASTLLDVNSFAVKGISIEHGRAMIIINNHTFALGDEGDVLTTSGRVHIRLAEIRHSSVIIEVNGARRELSTAIK